MDKVFMLMITDETDILYVCHNENDTKIGNKDFPRDEFPDHQWYQYTIMETKIIDPILREDLR